MATKTWVPGLIVVLKVCKHYMTKWQTQLHTHLTTEQYACLESTLAAVINCLILLGASE